MELIKKAINHEKEKEIFFNESNKLINNKFLKRIFVFFSKESIRHYKILEKVLTDVNHILYNSKINFISVNFSHEINKSKINKLNTRDSIRIINDAIKYKKISQIFYLKKSINIKQVYIKNIFLQFADEEYNHYTLLEQILKNINKSKNQNNAHNFTNKKVDSYILEKVS